LFGSICLAFIGFPQLSERWGNTDLAILFQFPTLPALQATTDKWQVENGIEFTAFNSSIGFAG
jgi:hypothetical protein